MNYLYGASYSPLVFPESAWESDLRLMKEAGMNLVRTGDVHGSWDRVELQEGNYQLDTFIRFYEMAAQFDQQVIFTTGASCPPLWLQRKHPDVVILSNLGQQYPMAASYHWACIHHPAFLEASDRYLRNALLPMALAQPNHFGWQITNEIGFPFMPTQQNAEIELYCYCEHCQAKFREWVQQKYGTLTAVSDAWMWGTTAFWYNEWDDIEAPRAKPSAWSGVTRWLDWRLFWQWAFANFARRQHDLIKQQDSPHPTSVNMFNFKGFDRFGTFTGLDQWQIAQNVDHIGYDLYPGSGNKLASRPEHNSIFLDHGRSVSQSAGTDFWLHEMESGPIGGWLMGPDYNTGPVDIWRNGFEALGHDVKLLLYQPWREWDYQPLHWGALVDLDGNETPRLKAAAGLGQFIRNHDAFLQTARVPRGEVAILESKANAIFLRGVNQEEDLFAAQRGAYRALWELDYRVDFITPAQVINGTIDDYKVVLLPLMGLIDAETAVSLSNFVNNGGLLVGFARCGTLDHQGWSHHQLPISGLREAFGLVRVEADSPPVPPIRWNGRSYPGYKNRDLVEAMAETAVLATFEDGNPAITLAKYGTGHGLYIATQADSGYLQTEGGLLKTLMADLLPQLGIKPGVTISYTDKNIREIDPHLLVTPSRSMILLANYHQQDVTARVAVKGNGRSPHAIVAGILEEEPVRWDQQDDTILIDITLPQEEPMAITIDWHDTP
ncbi:MAG: hypothetical protein DWQ04_16160 [Chloroflexi bacterium]|nr:MAG: hypothetical protein DWQ04_16160 [Chloroflexota bacterium]